MIPTRNRWVPRLGWSGWGGATMSDNCDADAEGVSITFEWLGIIVEFWLAKRGRQ